MCVYVSVCKRSHVTTLYTYNVLNTPMTTYRKVWLISAHAACWQWAGPKLHSLLSACRLIGAYFLTTESDKCMRLLTRLYCNNYNFFFKDECYCVHVPCKSVETICSVCVWTDFFPSSSAWTDWLLWPIISSLWTSALLYVATASTVMCSIRKQTILCQYH